MEMRIFQMPLVRSKHEKGFNSSSSLQVPKVVFVGYKMEISSFLSVAMAATSTSNPSGPSFSTSGLKTPFFLYNTALACIVYLCLLSRKIYRLPEKVRVCWLRNGNFFPLFFSFFLFYSYSTCLQPPAEVVPKGWSFNLRPRDKKSSKAQKSTSYMCLLHTQKVLLAWSCLQWWLSLESSTIPLVRAFIHKPGDFSSFVLPVPVMKSIVQIHEGAELPE